MQTWEYMLLHFAQGKVIQINDEVIGGLGKGIFDSNTWKGPSLMDHLQKAGAAGWEAVGISDNFVLLKRPSMK